MISDANQTVKDKKFEVQISYTGFCTYQVEAKDKSDAIKKARELTINNSEISNNLENWEDGDEAEELK